MSILDLGLPKQPNSKNAGKLIKKTGEMLKGGGGDLWFMVLLGVISVLSITPLFLSDLGITPGYLVYCTTLLPFVILALRANARLKNFNNDIHLENFTLKKFTDRAREDVEKIKESPTVKITADDVEKYVSSVDLGKTSTAKEFISEVATGNYYIASAPIEHLLHPHRFRYETRLNEAYQYGVLCTRLGILGTFAGLVFALFSLADLFANLPTGVSIEDKLPDLAVSLDKLSYAFITSIYGLLFSIAIFTYFNSSRKNFIKFCNVFGEAIGAARHIVNRLSLSDPLLPKSLYDTNESLKVMEQRLLSHGEAVDKAMRKHGQEITNNTDVFKFAAEGLSNVQKTWQGSFENLKQATGEVNSQARKTMSVLNDGFSDITKNFGASLEKLKTSQEGFEDTRKQFSEAFSNADKNWEERLVAIVAQIKESQNNQAEQNKSQLDLINSIKGISEDMLSMKSEVTRLSGECNRILKSLDGVALNLANTKVNGNLKPSIGFTSKLLTFAFLFMLTTLFLFGTEVLVLGDPLGWKQMVVNILLQRF